MKNRKMFLISQTEDGFWICERTEEGFKAMDSSNFEEHPERWTEWEQYDSVELFLEKINEELIK